MKCGIEIHQRLATAKLFCSCPSQLEEGKEADIRIERYLHPVLSELGQVDRAALAEFQKGKKFEYGCYHASNCLVETDEEPPHALNSEALAIALQVSLQMNAAPVDEVHCMRKIVIDGSNTGGFQRTAIVAMEGGIDTTQGRVGITQVALEEESAGIVETKEDRTVYRLDRLGIPLVEISTEPEIKSPEHCREVAEKIGMILRATGRVARGIGTIRQDVNISIEGGARVEIKGAQELKQLPLLVENEVRRQKELLTLLEEIKHRVYGKEFVGEAMDVSEIFQATESKLIAAGLQQNEKVFGMRIERHAGLLGKEINPNRRYATELSEYAKPAGVKGIIHSDEDLKKYGMTESEMDAVRQRLKAGHGDAFVLVVAPLEIAHKALQKVRERLQTFRVPEETRRANPDGTSSYMRPLPGSARMYPETDVPPIELNKEFLRKMQKQKGESLEEKQARFRELLHGNTELVNAMISSPRPALFEQAIKEKIEPVVVATTMTSTCTYIRRETGKEPSDEEVIEALRGFKEGKWVKAAIPEILRNPEKKNDLQRITGKELEKLAEENGYEFGKIMAQHRLRVDAAELQEILKFAKAQRS